MPEWRNGRRTRLKIWHPFGYTGSTPVSGIIDFIRLNRCRWPTWRKNASRISRWPTARLHLFDTWRKSPNSPNMSVNCRNRHGKQGKPPLNVFCRKAFLLFIVKEKISYVFILTAMRKSSRGISSHDFSATRFCRTKWFRKSVYQSIH